MTDPLSTSPLFSLILLEENKSYFSYLVHLSLGDRIAQNTRQGLEDHSHPSADDPLFISIRRDFGLFDGELYFFVIDFIKFIPDIRKRAPLVDFPFLVDEIFLEFKIFSDDFTLIEIEFGSLLSGELGWASGDGTEFHLIGQSFVEDLLRDTKGESELE